MKRFAVLIALMMCGQGLLAQEDDAMYFSKKDRSKLREAKKTQAANASRHSRFQNPDYQPGNKSYGSPYRYWDRSYAIARTPQLSFGIGYGIPAWVDCGFGSLSYDPWLCQRRYWGLGYYPYSGYWGWNTYSFGYYSYGFYDPYYGAFNPYLGYNYYYYRPFYQRPRTAETPRVNIQPGTIRRQPNTNSTFRPSPSYTPSNSRGSSPSFNRGGGNAPTQGVRRAR